MSATARAICLLSSSISRLRRRIWVTRRLAISAGGLGSPRSSLAAASSPRWLVSAPVRVWYPQRIFSRSACRRLMAAVRSMNELAAVVDGAGEALWRAGEPGGGQVVVPCCDAGDLERVDAVAFGGGAPSSARRGGHLRGHLHHRHPSRYERLGRGAAVVA